MATASPHQLRRSLFAALAYLATTWLSVWLSKKLSVDASIWLRVVTGLLPLLPISYGVRVVVQIILAGDELQRRIDLEAIAVASVAVGLGALTLSLLRVANVVTLSGRQALLWVFPALWMGYALARVWVARRYR